MVDMFPYPVPPRRHMQQETLRVVRANTLQQIKRLVTLLAVMQVLELVYLMLVVVKR